MLYDPKWDASPYSLPAFIGWLETQSPDRIYKWMSCEHCLVGIYMCEVLGGMSAGLPAHGDLLGRGWPYYEVCRAEPHTFGAALERARGFAS